MKKNEPMTVKDYANLKGCNWSYVYKLIRENKIRHEKRFGVYVVFPDKQSLCDHFDSLDSGRCEKCNKWLV